MNSLIIDTNSSIQISPSVNPRPRFELPPNAESTSILTKVDVIIMSAHSPLPPIGLKHKLKIFPPFGIEFPKVLFDSHSTPITPIGALFSE